MKKNVMMAFGLLAFLLAFTGCNNIATFDYVGAPGTLSVFREAGAARKSVAVVPFMDQRGAKYFDVMQARQAERHPVGDRGSFLWGYFPLVPVVFIQKEEPENSVDFVSLGRFHFQPQKELANAAVLSLKASRMFSNVSIANNLEQAQADYVWRGTVTNMCYKGCIYPYLITNFLAPALWAIGFPMGTSFNELCVRFELVDRSNGNVVWTYDYSGRDFVNHWIYARIGADVRLYPQLMKQAMNGALYDLNRKKPDL